MLKPGGDLRRDRGRAIRHAINHNVWCGARVPRRRRIAKCIDQRARIGRETENSHDTTHAASLPDLTIRSHGEQSAPNFLHEPPSSTSHVRCMLSVASNMHFDAGAHAPPHV